MNKLIAQTDLFPDQGFKGIGTGPLANPTDGPAVFASLMSSIIGLMTIVAILWFIFVFITGAIGIINAGGDKQYIETARKKIIQGVIGLVIVISAIFIIDFVGFLLGFESGGLFDITNLIQLIQIKP
jgi:hypothetical protein